MNIQDTWFEKDRSETSSNRRPDKTFNNILVKNEALGLDLYKNVFTDNQIKKYIKWVED